MDKSVSQSISQSVNQSVSQSVSQSISQSVNRSFSQSIYPLESELLTQSVRQPVIRFLLACVKNSGSVFRDAVAEAGKEN